MALVLSPRITLKKFIPIKKMFTINKIRIDKISKLGVHGPVLKNVKQNNTTTLLMR